MRLLIAITTCRARTFQADAQRQTWAAGPNRPWYFGSLEADVMFFVGGEGLPNREDEVVLSVDDSYQGLPNKVRHVMGWAISQGYDGVLKLDDDVFLVPKRLGHLMWDYEYAGNFRMRNGNYPADYASGFCYFLNRRAMELVASAELTEDTMEDRWVGNLIDRAKPRPRAYDEKRFCCVYPSGIDEAKYLWGSPIGKTHVAFAQYPAHKFDDMNYWYLRCFDAVAA